MIKIDISDASTPKLNPKAKGEVRGSYIG